MRLTSQQTQGFTPSYLQCNNHGIARNRHVVVELANVLHSEASSRLSVQATAQIEWPGISSIHAELAEFGTTPVSTHVSYGALTTSTRRIARSPQAFAITGRFRPAPRMDPRSASFTPGS